MLDALPARLRSLSPGWWSAVAGAAGAGAIIVPAHRVVAALVGGGTMLAIALWQEKPCCASCAESPGPTAVDEHHEPAPAPKVETWTDDFGLATNAMGQKGSCP
jgi:hypothetical protein